MKHFILSLLLLSFILAGCATTQPESSPDLPELVSMTSLPQISPLYPMSNLKLNVLFHINSDGFVQEVKLMKSSGDPDWDKAAVDSMKLWRFTALRDQRQAGDRWIRNTIILQIQEPTILSLAEMKSNRSEEADSLFALLKGGTDFETLCKQLAAGSSEPRGKFLGATDISRYPKHVRDALRALAINDFTRPLRIGNTFVLFKRYKPDGMDILK